MIKYFEKLNDIFNAATSDLQLGDVVVTGGYGSVNDGGASTYYVTSINNTNNADLDITGKTFSKGSIQLELMFNNGEVNVEQFGAQSTASATTNMNAIQAAINSGARRVNFRPAQYNVGNDILINHPVDIVGNGAELVLETASTSTQLFRVEYAEGVVISPASIRDMKIVGSHTITQEQVIDSETNEINTVEKITNHNVGINLVNATDYTISGVDFKYGDYAIHVTNSSTIIIENCACDDVTKALYFSNASAIKVKNIKAKLLSLGSRGIIIMGNTNSFVAEDVSIINANIALFIHDIPLSDESKATDRIFFKNLLVDQSSVAAWFRNTYTPVCFSNAMFVDIRTACFILTKAENINVNNSSVLLVAPVKCAVNSAPIHISGAAKIKFTHTQFEFPRELQLTQYNHSYWGDVDVSFVDCTIQKTDITGVAGVEKSVGFGEIDCVASITDSFKETFDACEFRSYITDYSETTGEGENAVTTYNFPITLTTSSNSGSKLIIKNCRFVNDSTCTVPYFKLDDNAKFDNIVVYNCFFENYEFSKGEGEDKHYPIFGRVVDGAINTDNTDSDNETIHNIFARCNMRSSAPDRTNGTTINETLEYI